MIHWAIFKVIFTWCYCFDQKYSVVFHNYTKKKRTNPVSFHSRAHLSARFWSITAFLRCVISVAVGQKQERYHEFLKAWNHFRIDIFRVRSSISLVSRHASLFRSLFYNKDRLLVHYLFRINPVVFVKRSRKWTLSLPYEFFYLAFTMWTSQWRLRQGKTPWDNKKEKPLRTTIIRNHNCDAQDWHEVYLAHKVDPPKKKTAHGNHRKKV